MLKQFVSVKKIIALLLTLVFCYLSVMKLLSSTEFLSVFTLVIGYYFGQSTVIQATAIQANKSATNEQVTQDQSADKTE
ncbi:hypothetical protein [Candidatus Clostridium radicumherbarum]|uniref:Uncharacterized protein n=1 Tax=Candidatus Clostridium radicumherbarum TaxID=3381662 RepID=A0ABW8TV06_9CLOT